MQDFSFAEVMEKLQAKNGEITRTHPNHLSLDQVNAAVGVEVRRENRAVDLDEEMLKLTENQLMYRITSKLIAKKFEGLKYIIDEGGK